MFDQLEKHHHEQVLWSFDAVTGCRCIIAIHNTTLGPALGGCRLLPYASPHEALSDVLKLARGMTYKSALAGLPLGGGKAVIIADPKDKSPMMFRAFGRFVDSLGGRYITSVDMNTVSEDLRWVREVTPHVVGLDVSMGGAGSASVTTAYGVFCGLKAAITERFQQPSFHGLKVAVQGLGSVGRRLCYLLHREGAQLVVSDIRSERIQDMVDLYGAEACAPEGIHAAAVDVFAPCARGGILHQHSISEIQAAIVGGAANNQLGAPEDAVLLQQKGILYCPDYVINAGGLIHVYFEMTGYDAEKVQEHVEGIEKTLLEIFLQARRQDRICSEVSDELGAQKVKAVQARHQVRSGTRTYDGDGRDSRSVRESHSS